MPYNDVTLAQSSLAVKVAKVEVPEACPTSNSVEKRPAEKHQNPTLETSPGVRKLAGPEFEAWVRTQIRTGKSEGWILDNACPSDFLALGPSGFGAVSVNYIPARGLTHAEKVRRGARIYTMSLLIAKGWAKNENN